MQENGIVKLFNFLKKLLSGIAISFSCIIIVFLLTNTILAHLNANNENYKPLFSLYTIVVLIVSIIVFKKKMISDNK